MDVPEGMEVIPNGWDSPVHGYPLGHQHWYTIEVDQQGREVGCLVWHPHPSTPGGIHAGGVLFDTEAGQATQRNAAHWHLVSRDPLHIEPSVLCSCGDHGFIRNGRWESA